MMWAGSLGVRLELAWRLCYPNTSLYDSLGMSLSTVYAGLGTRLCVRYLDEIETDDGGAESLETAHEMERSWRGKGSGPVNCRGKNRQVVRYPFLHTSLM